MNVLAEVILVIEAPSVNIGIKSYDVEIQFISFA